MFKRIIATILLLLFCNMNIVYAENWVTITAENGKSADLDLDSLEMVVNAVEYDIRTTFNDVIFVNKLSTELYKEGTPTAVIHRKKYKNSIARDNLLTEEKITKRDYKVVKPGTLQAEIYDILSKRLGEKNFNKGYKIWKKYLKQQRKTIQKNWRPPAFKNLYSINKDKHVTPMYQNTINLRLDKNGVVKQRSSDNQQITLNTIQYLDPLPEEYRADTFELGINVNYYKYAGAKLYNDKPAIKQISPVKAEVSIAKNSRPPVFGHIQFGLLAVVTGLASLTSFLFEEHSSFFPLTIVSGCFGLCTFVMTGAFALLAIFSGVSPEDI